jgi:hypothetical protein
LVHEHVVDVLVVVDLSIVDEIVIQIVEILIFIPIFAFLIVLSSALVPSFYALRLLLLLGCFLDLSLMLSIVLNRLQLSICLNSAQKRLDDAAMAVTYKLIFFSILEAGFVVLSIF